MRLLKNGLFASTTALAIGMNCVGAAQSLSSDWNIQAQDLKTSLQQVAKASGFEIITPIDQIKGKRSAALRGSFTPEQALRRLVQGTGLSIAIRDGVITLQERSTAYPAATGADLADESIVVTGTLVRGTQPASPLVSLSRDAILTAGQRNLAEAIRNIPQNFGGGQNAGIGVSVPESRGSGGGAATSLNLRGLGSDATLTLLNGHRLAYNAANQSIDISAIPVVALERIEIVPDGASALYGSDAVGGVANIILRRDYDGLLTTARLGGSTGGGNRQQQYDALLGTRWAGGGVMIAYEYARQTPIRAEDRSYAATTAPGLFLFPGISQHNVVASGHQQLAGSVGLQVDALFGKRSSSVEYAYDLRGDVELSGARSSYKSQSFAVAPRVRFSLPADWIADLVGSYGFDHFRYDVAAYAEGEESFRQIGCYCNAAYLIEGNANGTLTSLPSGDIKVAAGGGWRRNALHGYRNDDSQNIDVGQDTYYGFGEVTLPLVGPQQEIRFIDRLTLSGAVRTEHYPGIDTVTTPKFGLILAPSPDIDLKTSWGKSFKAPTLYQQYSETFVNIYTAASRGGIGYPANATAIVLSGGNRDLKPERATTWSTSLTFHPRRIPHSLLELNYYRVNYRNRIVTPITFPSLSLRDPAYVDLREASPSASRIAAVTADDASVYNTTSRPFNPADVVAIINNNNRNAARQIAHGIDARAAYDFDLGADSNLSLQASASYIRIRQRLSALQASTNLAGTIYNIPHYRARGGATWTGSGVTLSSFINYTGGVDDVRQSPAASVRSMTTIDAALSYAFRSSDRFLKGLELSLSGQNLLGRKPSPIRATQPYETPYDSINYTPFGRVISATVSKKW